MLSLSPLVSGLFYPFFSPWFPITCSVMLCGIYKACDSEERREGCSMDSVDREWHASQICSLESVFVALQVASRTLGIPTAYIHINETSTNTVPNTSATAASVSTDLNGMAVSVRQIE